jgi:hypothetical protein
LNEGSVEHIAMPINERWIIHCTEDTPESGLPGVEILRTNDWYTWDTRTTEVRWFSFLQMAKQAFS